MCMCVRVRVCAYVCVRVCMRVWERRYASGRLCVCMCVFVYDDASLRKLHKVQPQSFNAGSISYASTPTNRDAEGTWWSPLPPPDAVCLLCTLLPMPCSMCVYVCVYDFVCV